MNGVGFGDSSRTSVPKIMASYPPPPVGLDTQNGVRFVLIIQFNVKMVYIVYIHVYKLNSLAVLLIESNYLHLIQCVSFLKR